MNYGFASKPYYRLHESTGSHPSPLTWRSRPRILLLLREFSALELRLLLLGAGLPELFELVHGERVVLGGEVLLEVDDGVFLGYF